MKILPFILMRLCGIALGGGVVCEYRTGEGYVNINCRLTSSVEVLLNGVCVPLVVCTVHGAGDACFLC